MKYLLTLTAVVIAHPALAADWPQWRGPNRDGVARDGPKEWPKELKRSWRVEVGEGHSSPVVANDRVYQLARTGNEEVLRALQLSDGSTVWSQKLKTDADLDGAVGWHGKTPKSTPCVADGRVFAFSINGILSAYDAAKGTPLWKKSFEKQFPKTWPLYGSATSPIVFEGLVAVWVGGHDKGAFKAFDVKTGTEKWSLPVDGPGYASPILAELGGRKQLITLSQKFLLGVDATSGKELWKVKFTTGYDQNTVTPLLVKDLLVYSGYQRALYAGKPQLAGATWQLKEAWELREHPLYMNSPVVFGDRIFGLSQKDASLIAVNAVDGTLAWSQAGVTKEDYAVLLLVGRWGLLQSSDGRLVIFDPREEKFVAVAEYTLSESKTWAHPAITSDKLLTKDHSHLTCWSLK